MPKTSFYIALSTPQVFESGEYEEQAELMASMFSSIFSDVDKISILTKAVELTSCDTNVEVSQCETGLVARAVIDVESTVRVTLDKTKLSQMLKKDSPWSDMKVEKRLVPVETSEQASDAVSKDTAVVA